MEEVEAPERNEQYLKYITERDMTFFSKILGDMKKETQDLLDSGLFQKAYDSLDRRIEKEKKKRLEKEKEKDASPPDAAEEEKN